MGGFTDADNTAVNAVRLLAADGVQKANSGHPGAPMGCAPMAHALWTRFLKFSPENAKWPNRDRFVLSNGHASMLQYSLLHMAGYKVSMDDIKAFRQEDSITPGHPESHLTEGVETSTGPLGQGISNAVGMAIAQEHLAATFNKPGFTLFDNHTYVICGDGCMQEGVACEAVSLAGHLGLGKLIVLYDDNSITIDGATDLSFSEDVCKRFEAYNWHTLKVSQGDDNLGTIAAAIEEGKKVTDRPTLIAVKTTIGFGSLKEGSQKTHGAPLGADDLKQVKSKFGFDPELSFNVPDSAYAIYRNQAAAGNAAQKEWAALFQNYKAQFGAEAAEIERRFERRLPANWESALPRYQPGDKDLATRQTSQATLNKLGKVLPELMGGSADLAPSCLTMLDGIKAFSKTCREGRNMHFGVREHGMAAVMNGMEAYGGLVPYGSTFFNFLGYSAGALRVAALSGHGVLHICTHDSIALGEDGPTHQPIETAAHFRATPNVSLIRPADGNETSGAYAQALTTNAHRPTIIVASRQGLPQLEGSSVESVAKGAYVLQDVDSPRVILIGTGSEVQLCVKAAALASDLQVRVVSMPSWDLYEAQPAEYKRHVFPAGVPVLSVEALGTMGWAKYSHVQIGMTTFGHSCNMKAIHKKFGFTPENVCEKMRSLVEFYSSRPVPELVERPF